MRRAMAQVILCEAQSLSRLSTELRIYRTELRKIRNPVPAISGSTPGEKTDDSGPLFCHSAAENWSCALKEKGARGKWVIFPKKHSSLNGSHSCPRILRNFRGKSGPEWGAGAGGGPKATTYLLQSNKQNKLNQRGTPKASKTNSINGETGLGTRLGERI